MAIFTSPQPIVLGKKARGYAFRQGLNLTGFVSACLTKLSQCELVENHEIDSKGEIYGKRSRHKKASKQEAVKTLTEKRIAKKEKKATSSSYGSRQ